MSQSFLKTTLFLCLASTTLVPQTVQAAAPAKAAVCMACHGANGISTMDIYPNLAGQKKAYLIQTLKEYKSGKRKNAVMQGMAAMLSDKDIEELAAYYSILK